MLITILVAMMAAYAAWHFIAGGFPGGLLGAAKGGYHWLLGLSVWSVIWVLWKLLWWGLVILSIDILTPPYGIDIESLFAIPLATAFKNTFHWSLGWALGIAYALVFATAAGILLFHWFVYRKHVK